MRTPEKHRAPHCRSRAGRMPPLNNKPWRSSALLDGVKDRAIPDVDGILKCDVCNNQGDQAERQHPCQLAAVGTPKTFGADPESREQIVLRACSISSGERSAFGSKISGGGGSTACPVSATTSRIGGFGIRSRPRLYGYRQCLWHTAPGRDGAQMGLLAKGNAPEKLRSSQPCARLDLMFRISFRS